MSPPTVPDYRFLRPIGRGAYGEVWLACNVMGTFRAIKLIWRRQFNSDRPFEREFAGIRRYEPVSRSSGGLVHVLHVGRNEAEGYFYYVMELADPLPCPRPTTGNVTPEALSSSDEPGFDVESYHPRILRAELRRGEPLSVTESVRLGLDIVGGLAQLHHRDLVHRDVKPANIIYVNGRAKLADIGLISPGGEGRTFVGTEGYIPPEGPGSVAADLYALGMVLYECNTGLPPDRFPDIPTHWLTEGNDDRLEFQEVIQKACEGQRERRYQRAEEMQADLALLQSGQSLRQMRVMKRRYARLRTVLVLGAVVLICALVATVFANYRAQLAAENRAKEAKLRQQTQEALTRTEAAEHAARQQLYTALLEQARATVRSGEMGQRTRALDAIRSAAVITNTAELRGVAMSAMALPDFRFERQLHRTEPLTGLRFDPTFQRVALCRGKGDVEICSGSDGHVLQPLAASAAFAARLARWSPDGRFLAIKRDREDPENHVDVEVWNVDTVQRLLLLPHLESGSISYHPSLPQILVGLTNGIATLWDLNLGREVSRYELGNVSPWQLSFSPKGDQFAALFRHPTNSTLAFIRTSDGVVLRTHVHPDWMNEIDWDPKDSSWVGGVDEAGVVQLIDSATGAVRVLGRHKVQAVHASFTPDGGYLLTGGWEREFICWDLRRGERALTLGLNNYRAQFSANGRWCAIVSDGTVRVYAFELPDGHREFPEDLGPRLHYAAFSQDGHWIAASASKRVGVWSMDQQGPGAILEDLADARLMFSESGELYASNDQQALRTGMLKPAGPHDPIQLTGMVRIQPRGFTSLCLSSNQVLITGTQGTATLPQSSLAADPAHWTPTIKGLSGASSDGRWLGIYGPYRNSLHVYRTPELSLVGILTNRASIAGFEFSPRGDEVGIASFKGVERWSTTTWERIGTLTNTVGLFYGADGRHWWLRRDFRISGLYTDHGERLLLPLPLGALPITLSRDDRYLAISLDARRLQVWDLNVVRDRLRSLGLDWAE
ncbi:MAG: protein kinase [Verrucomicrobia bacterium]|nr:protein kinase [Verrucomicrobiota bacterium]